MKEYMCADIRFVMTHVPNDLKKKKKQPCVLLFLFAYFYFCSQVQFFGGEISTACVPLHFFFLVV